VGPNAIWRFCDDRAGGFQSSVRINVGPNRSQGSPMGGVLRVSILRED